MNSTKNKNKNKQTQEQQCSSTDGGRWFNFKKLDIKTKCSSEYGAGWLKESGHTKYMGVPSKELGSELDYKIGMFCQQLLSCVKVKVAVLGSPFLTVLMVSVNVKQH